MKGEFSVCLGKNQGSTQTRFTAEGGFTVDAPNCLESSFSDGNMGRVVGARSLSAGDIQLVFLYVEESVVLSSK